MRVRDILVILSAVSFSSMVSNAIGSSHGLLESLPGVAVLMVFALAGWGLAQIVPFRLPAVVWTVIIGCALTCPWVPGTQHIVSQVSKVDFVSLCTPVLAYAGVAFGKDVKGFLATGWKSAVVATLVFAGTYFGSALIAHGMLRLLGL